MIEGEWTVENMMRKDGGYYHIIQMERLYLSQIKRRIISPQVIHTQGGKPIFLEIITGGTGLITNEH